MSHAKFHFDNQFGAKVSGARGAARKQPAKDFYSRQEMEKIRDEAFAEGRKCEEAQAAQALALGVGQVAEALLAIIDSLDGEIARARTAAAEIACLIGKKLARHALARFPQAEIEGIALECLNTLPGSPRVVVRAQPETAEALRHSLSGKMNGQGAKGRISIVADETAAGGLCTVEWPDGGLERRPEDIAASIEERIRAWIAGHAESKEQVQ